MATTLPVVTPTDEALTLPGGFEADLYDSFRVGQVASRFETLDPLPNREVYQGTDEWRDSDLLGSIALARFIEQHPGMGTDERNNFRDIVVSFVYDSTRLAAANRTETAWTQLDQAGFDSLTDQLSTMYLASVFSTERRAAEQALSQYYRLQKAEAVE